MKVLIVSDIHGNFKNMKKVIQNNSSFDRLLILGDILSGPSIDGYDPKQLALFLNLYKDKIISVRGNCDNFHMDTLDFFVDKSFLTLSIDSKLFFLTHGHLYNPTHLPDLPFDVFLSGHTHVPMMEKVDGRLFLNPGSITSPRGGSLKSYIFYEEGEFFLKDVDENKVLKKLRY